MEYTKGEWKAIMGADGSRLIYAEKEGGDELICRDVRHYNINLLLAAPDMYEALVELAQWFEGTTTVSGKATRCMNKVYKALAKVEGKGE